MKRIIILLLLLTISIHGKDILKKVGTYNLGKLETQHTRADGVKFTRKWSLTLEELSKNYLNLYSIGMTHYDKYNDIPSYATFYIFNLETKKKEIIKLPLLNFINKNKNLFLDNKFLKTYKDGRKRVKPLIEIIHYDKDSSGYLLTDYARRRSSDTSVHGIRNYRYSTVYLHWNHKTNELWGEDINQFDTKHKAKIISYDRKNQRLYYHISSRKNSKIRINLIYLDLKTKKTAFMIDYKRNAKNDKNIYIRSEFQFDNYNKFLLLEYSEHKKSPPKGYLIYKDEKDKFRVKEFGIPLTAYGVGITKDGKKLFIGSNKEKVLIYYNLKTLKVIKKRRIPSGIHHLLLSKNDTQIITFHNTAGSGSKRGINIYSAKNLKKISHKSYKPYLGFDKFFAQYTMILKESKNLIFFNPDKTGFPTKKSFSIFEYK